METTGVMESSGAAILFVLALLGIYRITRPRGARSPRRDFDPRWRHRPPDRKRLSRRGLLVLLGALISAAWGIPSASRPCAARTLRVPQDEKTVVAALGRAAAFDTVLVGPGRYPGGIRVPGGVSIIATAGPDSTILDGLGHGPVVSFGEVGPTTLLEGFTVTGGLLADEHGDGAGIRCGRHAAPRLNNLRITGNRALGRDGRGGGIACLDGASPIIANSRIEGNEAADGGGIYIGKRRGTFQSSPVVSGNMVLRNRARHLGGGLAITGASEPQLSLNVVAWNVALAGGGGLSIERARPQITSNVIWANTDSSAVAGGILLGDYAAPIIERNIVGRNLGGPGVRCEMQYQERNVFECNTVWGHLEADLSPECTVGSGNLSVDPEFCDPLGGRFELRPSSPCRDALGCGRIGVFGVGCSEEEVLPAAGSPALEQRN